MFAYGNLTIDRCLEIARGRANRTQLISYIRWAMLSIFVIATGLLVWKNGANYLTVIPPVAVLIVLGYCINRLPNKPYPTNYQAINILTTDDPNPFSGWLFLKDPSGEFSFVEDDQAAQQIIRDGGSQDGVPLTTLYFPDVLYLEIIDRNNRWKADICCHRIDIGRKLREVDQLCRFLSRHPANISLDAAHNLMQAIREQTASLLQESSSLKASEIHKRMEDYLCEKNFQAYLEDHAGYRIHKVAFSGKEDPVAASTR